MIKPTRRSSRSSIGFGSLLVAIVFVIWLVSETRGENIVLREILLLAGLFLVIFRGAVPLVVTFLDSKGVGDFTGSYDGLPLTSIKDTTNPGVRLFRYLMIIEK